MQTSAKPQATQTIPVGFCQCNCGGKTNLAPRNIRARNILKGEPFKFIVGHTPGNWKNGTTHQQGYLFRHCPEHPRIGSWRRYMKEAILIAEKALGHYLPPGAIVHHINGNRADDRPQNLVICQDRTYHMLLHRRQKNIIKKNQEDLWRWSGEKLRSQGERTR